MGLFDDLLKAVSNGSVEQRLNSAADKLETSLDKAVSKLEKTTDSVERGGWKASVAVQKASDLARQDGA